jgi:predicted Zn-dependent protease with MMP-like domain
MVPGTCAETDKVSLMADATDPRSFEEIVEWAYSTLPKKIRELPDFPGIQVVDEPPAEVLEEMSSREKWPGGTELLGLYSGILRTKQSFMQLKYAPDLIFVFRGPILRCSKGNLRAEVKRTVWHEVAHWLGFETEEQVKALGL